MPKLKKINQTIKKLTSAYGSNVGFIVSEVDVYWSSSKYSSSRVCAVLTDFGYVYDYIKNGSNFARAFLRVGV